MAYKYLNDNGLKAYTKKVKGALASYVAKADIVDTTGSATDKVMSQKAVTDNLALKANSSDVYTKEQADAITNPLAESLSRIFRDLGIYPELEPLPLNSEVTGKYINSDGKYVDASDWNVASIGAVSLGNTYLLNMVSSENMVLGVALFVSRVYKRDKEGKIIGTTLTPLFSAKNTSIPASGYVLFEAMDDYDEVLICYKPALTTQMLVARWGFKASHATQLRNLRMIVDNKTDFEGIYELLTAGYALNLVGKGNGEPQAFMSRKTGGGNITDGSAVIKEVDGVQPIVWNQLVQRAVQQETTYNGLTFYPQENGEVLIIGVATENTYAATYHYLGYDYKSVANHKAFVQIFGDATRTMKLYVTDDRQEQTNLGIVQWGTVAASGVLFIPKGYDCGEGVRLRFIVNDLTQMFGAGNEPTTYEEFLQLKPKVADEYAYNEGTIVDNKVEKVVTTGRNLFNPNVETEYLAVTGQSGSERYVKRFKALPGTYFIKSINNESVYVKSVINGVYGSARALNSNVTITLDSYGEIWVYSETEAKINGVANDICINVSDPVINGKYFPYEKHELDLAWIKDIKDGEGVKLFEDGMKSAGTAFDEVGKNKAVKRIGVKVFDGTELFERYVRDSNLAILYTDTLSKVRKVKAANVASALYKTATGSWNTMSSDKMICGYPDLGRIAFRDDIYTTAAAWKQHLADLYAAGTPLVVYYELAEPIEVEYDEKSLTYPVVAGGTEEAIASEPSSAFRADIGYGIDAVKTILDLKARVEALEAK